MSHPLCLRVLDEHETIVDCPDTELLPAELFDGEVDGLCDGHYRPGKMSQIFCPGLGGTRGRASGASRATVSKEDRIYQSLPSKAAFWT